MADEPKPMSARVDQIEQRLSEGDASLETLHRELAELKESLDGLRADTRAIREIVTTWNSIKGFVSVMQAVNRALWFVLKLAGAGAVIWGLLRTGQWIWKP